MAFFLGLLGHLGRAPETQGFLSPSLDKLILKESLSHLKPRA